MKKLMIYTFLCVNGTFCVMNIIYLNDGCSSTCFGISAINHNKTNCIYRHAGFFQYSTSKYLTYSIQVSTVVFTNFYIMWILKSFISQAEEISLLTRIWRKRQICISKDETKNKYSWYKSLERLPWAKNTCFMKI